MKSILIILLSCLSLFANSQRKSSFLKTEIIKIQASIPEHFAPFKQYPIYANNGDTLFQSNFILENTKYNFITTSQGRSSYRANLGIASNDAEANRIIDYWKRGLELRFSKTHEVIAFDERNTGVNKKGYLFKSKASNLKIEYMYYEGLKNNAVYLVIMD